VRARLRRALNADPAAAAELRSLLEECAPQPSPGPSVVVHNTISGGTQSGTAVQGQNFGALVFHAPAGPPGPAGPPADPLPPPAGPRRD
jgi:hypothetical protein